MTNETTPKRTANELLGLIPSVEHPWQNPDGSHEGWEERNALREELEEAQQALKDEIACARVRARSLEPALRAWPYGEDDPRREAWRMTLEQLAKRRLKLALTAPVEEAAGFARVAADALALLRSDVNGEERYATSCAKKAEGL